MAREGQSATFNATFFTVAAIAYLVVTLPLIGLVNAAEKRLRSGLVGHRRGRRVMESSQAARPSRCPARGSR